MAIKFPLDRHPPIIEMAAELLAPKWQHSGPLPPILPVRPDNQSRPLPLLPMFLSKRDEKEKEKGKEEGKEKEKEKEEKEEKESERAMVVREFISTEKNYLQVLASLLSCYLQPLEGMCVCV